MKPKTLSWIVGGVGTLVALAMLLGMSLMGSLLADARTEKLSGPGVDVFLRTPFPGPGDRVVLEVTARGGSKAGIAWVRVRRGGETLAEERGAGATWGRSISSGKSRGSKSTELGFRVPEGVGPGKTLPLEIEVAYVVAMKSGAGSFENQSRHDVVRLDVKVYSPSSRRLARTGLGLRAFVLLLVWFLLVWGVAYLLARDEELHGPDAGSKEDAEFMGIGLLMGLMGGGMVGYWFFARPLMAAWETQATLWSVILTALWVLLPLVFAIVWYRRRPKFTSYRCAVEGSAGPAREVDPSEVVGWLARDLGFRVKSTDSRIRAGKGKQQLRLRWSGRRIEVDGLVIQATGTEMAFRLAHLLSRRVGPFVLSSVRGVEITIDPQKTVEELMKEYMDTVLAEASRLLESLGKLRLPPRS